MILSLLLALGILFASAPVAAQTQQDAAGVLGWCTYLTGGSQACFGDPITACKAQYDNQAFGTHGFIGAEPFPDSTTYWWCKWNDLVYPSYVRFVCDGYTMLMPFSCALNDDAGTNNSCGGNPIELISGRKYETVLDFETADGRLWVERSYTSKRRFGNLQGGVLQYGGSGWSFNFGPQIELSPTFSSTHAVWLNLPDGQQYGFEYNSTTSAFEFADSTADARIRSRFTVSLVGGAPGSWASINSASSSWTVADRDTGTTYTIVSRKRPSQTTYLWGTASQIDFRGGYSWTLSYGSDAEIGSVADSFGRTLNFSWYTGFGLGGTQKALVKQIVLPDGTALNYSYKNLYTSTLGTAPSSWYDVMNKVEHVLSPTGSGSTNVITATTYHYEDGRFPYNLTGITDGRGLRYATWTYDSQGRGTSSFHGTSADTTGLAYSEPNSTTRIRTITNPLGRDAVYTFTKAGNQWLLDDVDGQASANCPVSNSSFTYSAKLMETQTDEEGRVTKFVRNSDGLPTKVTEAFGTSDARATDLTWAVDHQVTSVSQPGLDTTYGYDLAGRLTTVVETDITTTSDPYVTNGDTRTWAYTYTTEGLIASVDGPLPGTGDTVLYSYDTSGNLVSVTSELGHVTEITSHDDLGRPLSVEDPNGVITELAYSPGGYLETITVDPTGANVTTTIGYDAIGQVTSVAREDGSSFTYVYDGARRLTSVTDAAGNMASYGYDAMGNTTLRQVEDASSSVVFAQSATFDELGRLLTSVGVNSATWEYEYDKVSNLTQTTDPRSNDKDFAHNGLNELIQTTDEANYPVVLDRDGRGEIVTHTDPRSIETEYVRNGWGEIIQEVSADIGWIIYVRNELGLVTQRSDAKSHVRDYTYDDAGRLTSISYPTSSGENATLSYDDPTPGHFGIGKLTGFDSATGTTTRTYNSLGLLASETLDILGFVATTSYGYDAAGNAQSMTYPSGRVVTINRDANGEITGIDTQTTGSDPVVPLAQNIAWHPFGDIRELEFGNGLVWQRSVDLDYRLIQQKLLHGATPIIQLSYAYGDNLNLTSVSNDLDPAKDETYSYTANNMLETAVGPWGEDTFGYDGVGNITSHVNDFGGYITDNEAEYSATANHTASIAQNGVPVRSFTYDANGNVATDTSGGVTTEYMYGHADRMYAMERGGVQLGEYYYNIDGQLVLRIVTNTVPNGWTVYRYDQDGHLIAEYDGVSGDLLREYIWLGDRPLAVIEPGTTPTIYYIHSDHIGRPMAMTDAAGSLVNQSSWVVFGNALSITGSVGVDFRFPGQTYQFESGLHYNWHRQYDPSIARYTQPDPLGLVDGPSRYAYVRSDPLQKVDPTGLAAQISLIPPDSPSGLRPRGEAATMCASTLAPFPDIPSKKDCIAYCSDRALGGRGDQSMPFFGCLKQCMAGKEWDGRSW